VCVCEAFVIKYNSHNRKANVEKNPEEPVVPPTPPRRQPPPESYIRGVVVYSSRSISIFCIIIFENKKDSRKMNASKVKKPDAELFTESWFFLKGMKKKSRAQWLASVS